MPDQGLESAAATSDSGQSADNPLGSAAESSEPIATVTGTVPTIDGEVEAGVISVQDVGGQIRVVWGLRSADGTELDVDYMNGLAGDRSTTDDVRAATLELADGTRLETLLTGSDQRGTIAVLGCLCSNMPQVVSGEWTVLTSTFPQLPEGADPAGLTFQLPGADGPTQGLALPDLTLSSG